MTLCSDGHDEVCFDGRNCPVCAELDNIKDYKKTIETLEKQISDLE